MKKVATVVLVLLSVSIILILGLRISGFFIFNEDESGEFMRATESMGGETLVNEGPLSQKEESLPMEGNPELIPFESWNSLYHGSPYASLIPKEYLKEEEKLPDRIEGQYLVQFNPGLSIQDQESLINSYGGEVVRIMNPTKDLYISVVNIFNEKNAEDLKIDSRVAIFEPNYIATLANIPNDPLYNYSFPSVFWRGVGMTEGQWGFNKVNLPDAWRITQGSPSTVIAIIDTGVYWSHPDLAANIWINSREIPGNNIDDDGNNYIDDERGWDFFDLPTYWGYSCWNGEDCYQRDNDPTDFNGHGTHCAGIAGAVTNNGMGVAGACPNCKIMALRAGATINYRGNPAGILSNDAIIDSIYYASNNGAKVISMSFGGVYHSQLQENAIDYASSQNIILVGAAGNNAQNNILFYPAAFDNVISVSALDKDSTRAPFSNYGYWVDVAAPGEFIISTISPSSNYMFCYSSSECYQSLSGTSMAAPLVAGIMGLYRSINPSISIDEIKTLVHSKTNPYLDSIYYGPGFIDATQIVNSPRPLISKIDKQINNRVYNSGTIPVKFIARGNNFLKYNLEIKKNDDRFPLLSGSWISIRNDTFGQAKDLINIDPLKLKLEPGHYLLRLNVYDVNNNLWADYKGFSLDYSLVAGWPKSINKPIFGGVKLFDADSYGNSDEIIFSSFDSSGGLSRIEYNILDGSFNPLFGWPKYPGSFGTREVSLSVPAVGNIDGDGENEIFFDWIRLDPNYCSSLIPSFSTFRIYGYEVYSNFPQTGFPLDIVNHNGYPMNLQCAYYPQMANVVISNLDGVGDSELIIIRKGSVWTQGCTDHYLAIYNSSGQNRWTSAICAPYGPPAVGDINNDGYKEIVIVSGSSIGDPQLMWGRVLRVYSHDGSLLWSVPIYGYASPVLADFDKNDNGKLEIFVHSYNGGWFTGWSSKLFNDDGSLVFSVNSSRDTVSSYVPLHTAVGDINNDGFLDMIYRTYKCINALNHDGSVISGWPFCIGHDMSPINKHIFIDDEVRIIDLNGDGDKEVIFSAGDYVYALNKNGSYFQGFPKPIKSFEGMGTLVAGDVNGDGFIDLFYGDGKNNYLWSFPGQANSTNLVWPQYQHDAQNTGLYDIPSIPSCANPTPLITYVSNNSIINIPQMNFCPSNFNRSYFLELYGSTCPGNDTVRVTTEFNLGGTIYSASIENVSVTPGGYTHLLSIKFPPILANLPLGTYPFNITVTSLSSGGHRTVAGGRVDVIPSGVYQTIIRVGPNEYFTNLSYAISLLNSNPLIVNPRIILYPGTYNGPVTISKNMEIIGFVNSSGARPLIKQAGSWGHIFKISNGNRVTLKNLDIRDRPFCTNQINAIEVTDNFSGDVLLENMDIRSNYCNFTGVLVQSLNNPSNVGLEIRGSSFGSSLTDVYVRDSISTLFIEKSYFLPYGRTASIISNALYSMIYYSYLEGAGSSDKAVTVFPSGGMATLKGNVISGFYTSNGDSAVYYGGSNNMQQLKILSISSNTFIDGNTGNSANPVINSVINVAASPTFGFLLVNNIIHSNSQNPVIPLNYMNANNLIGVWPSNWFTTGYSLASSSGAIDTGYDFDSDPMSLNSFYSPKPLCQYVHSNKCETRERFKIIKDSDSSKGYDVGAYEYLGGSGNTCFESSEICDGIDNDCDGFVDENNVCSCT